MTTEAIIEMSQEGKFKKNINYSADGYPENVMDEIKYFANLYFTDKKKAQKTLNDSYNTDYLYKVSVEKEEIIVRTYFVTFKGKLKYLETTKYSVEKSKLKEEQKKGKQTIKDNQISQKEQHTIKYYTLKKGE